MDISTTIPGESLLIGESDTALAASEDLDLLTPFRTYGVGSRSQVMPVGDLKLGVDCHVLTALRRFVTCPVLRN